jgi:hypothetical protein
LSSIDAYSRFANVEAQVAEQISELIAAQKPIAIFIEVIEGSQKFNGT